MSKNNTKIILYISIFTTILIICLFVFVFRIVAHKNEHTNAVLATLAEKQALKNDSDNNMKKIGEVNSAKDAIYKYFIDPQKIDSLVDYLEKLGKDNGTDLSVNSIEPAKDSKNIVIQVSVTGSFSSVLNTISLIENSSYQVHINSVFLNKDLSIVGESKSGKATLSNTQKWRADISFNILSL